MNTDKIIDRWKEPTWNGIHEDIIFFAFRYALGRMTGAVDILVCCLKENWKELKPHTQEQIKREIKQAIKEKMAGHDCDIEKWKEILGL